MRTVPAFQVDVFTKTPFEGNPAAVVLETNGLTDEQIQRIVVGTLSVKVERQGDDYRIYMTQAVPQFEAPLIHFDSIIK